MTSFQEHLHQADRRSLEARAPELRKAFWAHKIACERASERRYADRAATAKRQDSAMVNAWVARYNAIRMGAA